MLTVSRKERASRHALVIGNAAYGGEARLYSPQNDARTVASSLEQMGFKVTLCLDVDRRNLELAYLDFRDGIDKAELALVYYSGHGCQIGGRNYLIPTDVKVSAANQFDKLKQFDVGRWATEIGKKAERKIFILDCCRDNPFIQNVSQDYWRQNEVAKAQGAAAEVSREGLAEMDAGPGTLLAFAAAPGRRAAEPAETLKGDALSFFTGALARHLDTYGLTLGELFSRTAKDVVAETKNKQVPWVGSSAFEALVLRPFPYTKITRFAICGLASALITWFLYWLSIFALTFNLGADENFNPRYNLPIIDHTSYDALRLLNYLTIILAGLIFALFIWRAMSRTRSQSIKLRHFALAAAGTSLLALAILDYAPSNKQKAISDFTREITLTRYITALGTSDSTGRLLLPMTGPAQSCTEKLKKDFDQNGYLLRDVMERSSDCFNIYKEGNPNSLQRQTSFHDVAEFIGKEFNFPTIDQGIRWSKYWDMESLATGSSSYHLGYVIGLLSDKLDLVYNVSFRRALVFFIAILSPIILFVILGATSPVFRSYHALVASVAASVAIFVILAVIGHLVLPDAALAAVDPRYSQLKLLGSIFEPYWYGKLSALLTWQGCVAIAIGFAVITYIPSHRLPIT